MNKRGPRPIFYVCIGNCIEKNDFISKEIQANSQNEATTLFLEKTGLKTKAIYGPYRHKRAQIIQNTRELRFSDIRKDAIYRDWEVKAQFLNEPENHAYLLFIKRVDGKKSQMPSGSVVVPISELRIVGK